MFDRLLLPQTLYGREDDVDRLLRAFDTACSGVAQLLLISGASGIGKTSLVGKLVEPVTARGTTFISSKAEEGHRQSSSYGAVIGALEDFVHQLSARDPPDDSLEEQAGAGLIGQHGTADQKHPGSGSNHRGAV
ncbi:MAG: AAA family ATPase [Kouleothrix sp.]|nr:AAA family ATPase [Kouleothrix sp.]